MANVTLFAHKRQLATATNGQKFINRGCWWPVTWKKVPTPSIIF